MLFGHRVNTLKHIFKNAKKISKLFVVEKPNVSAQDFSIDNTPNIKPIDILPLVAIDLPSPK